jgi:glycosyltransferase involved in cell wall biosynthesis
VVEAGGAADKAANRRMGFVPSQVCHSIKTEREFIGWPRRVGFGVVASSPALHLSGVHVFLANLYRELGRQNITGSLILTDLSRGTQEQGWGFPGTIIRLPATRWSEVRKRQDWVRERLLKEAPCVFLPNYDFDMGGICPVLPDEVIVVGIIHSDEPMYYDFFRAYGKYWNHTVAVSREIAAKLAAIDPGCAERLSTIPCGVTIPEAPASKPAGPLRVAYCGRLTRHQKRVDLLARVICECHRQGLAIEFSIAGAGEDEPLFRQTVAEAEAAGRVRMLGVLPNEAALKLLAESHAMILTSEFEGLPVVMLEAMGRACVPVVSAVGSGVNELVRDGENGFLVPIGDAGGFVSRLGSFARNRGVLRDMGLCAFETIRSGPYSARHTAMEYLRVFERSHEETRAGRFHRARGRREIPAHYRLTTRVGWRLRKLLIHGDRTTARVDASPLQSSEDSGR